MSTAGRVLTVVVILAVIGWIVIMAKVAALNTNWGEKIVSLEQQIEQLDGEIATTKANLNQTLVDVRTAQEQKDGELLVLRAQLSKLSKQEAVLQEAINDVQLQIQLVQDATRDAESVKQKRIAEKAQTEQDLAMARADVENLQEVVGSLMGQLQRLQSSFIATHQQNQQMMQRLKGTEAASPRTRPASFIR